MAEASHPLQNRVTPFGEIVAIPERGLFMGNRGNLHNARKQLTRRRWTTTRWITCVLEFKGRHREVMTPGSYTELFFLDEATAFAAGHRPCAECRRADYNRFIELWMLTHGLSARPRVDAIDAVLQDERVTPSRIQRTWRSRLEDLPPGTMVRRIGESGPALLWWDGRLWPWSPGGYATAQTASLADHVEVLTPPSIAKVFAAGYLPLVHPSASD
jgi:hypothetical protein